MSFARAQKIADAVLLEGYVLYPYRASSTKNQYRWTFGVLAPQRWSERGGCEPWWLEAQVLALGDAPALRGRLRFLQVIDRRVEIASGDAFRAALRLDVAGQTYLPWEEGELREIDFAIHSAPSELTLPFAIDAGEAVELLRDGHDETGAVVGRVARERSALRGELHVRVEPARAADDIATNGGTPPLWRVSVRVANVTPHASPEAPRAAVMRAAFVSTHLVLALDQGRFVSLLDPPAHARAAAKACTSIGTHPVLAGEPGRFDLVLCSPIILYDHPQIAPESPGDFFDASEIDELLALRTATLTPEEKALARATDARAAALVDRVEALGESELARLHGAIRERSPCYSPGTRVRLRPDASTRRTDAQDFLYAGRSATIEAVREDVDGRAYLAVTLDDDPAAPMHRAKGRYHYYYADEVEPLDPEGP